MMIKNYLILTSIFLITIQLNAQVIVKPFKSNSASLNDFTEKFENKLTEFLSKKFFIPQRESDDALNEIDFSEIRDYFQKSIGPDFQVGEYILTGAISKTPKYDTRVSINIKVIDVKRNINIVQVMQDYLDKNELDLITENLANYIINKVPTWFGIVSVINKEMLTISYGTNRGAKSGEELDIVYSKTGQIVGTAEIDNVFYENSNCEFEIENKNFELDNYVFRAFHVQTQVDNKAAEYYRNSLADLSDSKAKNLDKKESQFEYDFKKLALKKNDWIVFTANNYQFFQDSLKGFYNKKTLSPLLFGLKINLGKSNTRVFLRGKCSLETTKIDTSYISSINTPLSKRKMFFWEAGLGVQQVLPIYDFIYPGFSIGASFIQMRFRDETEKSSSSFVYNGLNIEGNVNLSVNLGDFGVYGEMVYNLFPILMSESSSINYKGSAISYGLGLVFYFL